MWIPHNVAAQTKTYGDGEIQVTTETFQKWVDELHEKVVDMFGIEQWV